MSPLINYIYDKSFSNIFNLAEFYRNEKQYASAITFYLEASSLGSELDSYKCLIKTALCFEKQGNRVGTVLDTLYKAAALLPERYEAFFHIVRILNSIGRYHEAYLLAQIQVTKFTTKQLEIDCEYDDLYTIEFEKGVAAWWIGYVEESREIMYKIYTGSYKEKYVTLAYNNLRSIGYPRALNTHTPERYSKLKRKFPGAESITSNAQVMQDMFVLTALNGKKNGTYIEIGAADPIMFNNTYLLEKDFGWTGVSFEIKQEEVNKFRLLRKNPCICADATLYDYSLLDTEYDYLQVDCEPPKVTYEILEKVLPGKKFNVITFEHDAYKEGGEYRDKSRQLLSKDYVLTVPNVAFDKTGVFEDWWVHKSIFNESLLGVDSKTCLEYFYE
jgi:hypothetical protein